MATKKISALTALTSASSADALVIVDDSACTTNKITLEKVLKPIHIKETNDRVGIGVTNVASPFIFQVGDGSVDARTQMLGANPYALGLSNGAGNGRYYLGAQAGPAPDLIISNNNGTERMRVTNEGRVGIGTSAPAYTLHVAGDSQIRALATSAASGGTLTAAMRGTTYTYGGPDAKTFTLPSVSSGQEGSWFRFVKLGAGTLRVVTPDSDTIADSSGPGSCYNEEAGETYATLTLQLASSTKWVIVGQDGTWLTA